MEHEVFVPVAVQTLRDVLADSARVARCVPGLQQDADASAGPLSGRLKLRVGGHTITYRGALRVVVRDDGAYDVEGEGTEVRGGGGVKVALTARLDPAEDGTTLAFTGTASAEGRLADLPDDAVTSAAHRLLDRFAESLAETAGEGDQGAADTGPADRSTEKAAGGAAEADRADDVAEADVEEVDEGVDDEDVDDEDVDDDGVDDGVDEDLADDSDARRPTVFDAPVPPSSLDPFAVDDFPLDETAPDEPPAEAAHARRTMIGRSAEEVDHAPPRGRYAPVPGPDTTSASSALRWLAPAAALALASAVVVGRALRRRR
ncbi:SRPBCC domain-containing protein [Streptomyces sp. TRM49041]|uniref:SRPBCC domain-containing protein n=1 Tax=Streptomyces sp. TRM49041 TaxID=2603216 RepID=UPI0011F031B8|nr:SRPBCC domain-containing protein [Streptomyces sp. TRM49041]